MSTFAELSSSTRYYMHIIIFGATGQVGLQLIKQALWKGHTVKAFGRNVYDIIDMENEQLTLIKGALFDEKEVRNAMKGCDAVISALGGAADGTDKTRSLGMKNILAQMKNAGLQRIIAIGGAGVLQADDTQLLMETEDYPKEFLPVAEEHKTVFNLLQQSNLGWTLVCPPTITDAEPTGIFHCNSNYPPQPDNHRITSGDLALFMLQELDNRQYLQQRVGISN
jgi:uncharacterized protein